MPPPKFSIVVTCTRPRLVGAAIRSILAQDFSDFEVVVSDNSDAGCREVIESLADSRIRYLRAETRLPTVPHWNFAFSHACGDWQLLVCDDDAIAPGLLGLLDRMIDRYPDVDSIAWLSAPHAQAAAGAPQDEETLTVPDYPGGVRLLESATVLSHMFASGTGVYGETKREVPLISHAALSRRVIDEIRHRYGGALFLHICPMTTAAAAALALSTHTLRIDLPLRVLGNPPDSAGGHRKDPGTYKRMHRDAKFEHVPIRMMTIFPTTGAESLLRAQAALPDLLGGYRLDWANYFRACYQAVHEEDGPQQELQAIDEALGTFPEEIREAVNGAKGAAPAVTHGLSRRAAGFVLRRLRGLTGRDVGRPGVVKLRSAGLVDVADCARYLGAVVADDVRKLMA